jgi:hypothetical protein
MLKLEIIVILSEAKNLAPPACGIIRCAQDDTCCYARDEAALQWG